MNQKFKYGIITDEKAWTTTKILLNNIYNGCGVYNYKYSKHEDTANIQPHKFFVCVRENAHTRVCACACVRMRMIGGGDVKIYPANDIYI
jgi:hypothetical protein